MTKETMLNLINKHNDTVKFIGTLEDIKISAEALFRLMPLSSKMAALGLALTHEAREMGIDAKCCMQSGEIKVSRNPVMDKATEKEYDALKAKMWKASCNVARTNNDQTRQAYDDAINEIMSFEKERNLAN